jgi:hypothetical protein
VYLVGGTTALDPSAETVLSSLGYHTTRFAGPDRYGTAVAVAGPGLGDPARVIEADGTEGADAPAASAAASKLGGALLLTGGTTQAGPTSDYLAEHPAVQRLAVGGPAAAADPMAMSIVGTDRYATAAQVAAAEFAGPAFVGVAAGSDLADGVTGAADMGAAGGPVLLVPPSGPLPPSVATYLRGLAPPAHIVVYGGSAVVGDDVFSELAELP